MSNSSSSSSSSAKRVAEEARKLAEKRRTSTQSSESQAQSERAKDITATNVFAQIMLNPSISPEVKRDEMVKALTFSKESTKEENRAKLESFEIFKEYLQEQRKLLNREGIKLQDTEAFAELQTVIDEMTKSSLEFQERVKPLIDVLNAVFQIRKSDKITDVYKEIQNDKAWQAEQTSILEALKAELNQHHERASALEREKVRLTEDKSFLGLGPVRRSARERIAEIETIDQVEVASLVGQLIGKIEQQRSVIESGRNSENPELLAQKAVLKNFLDLTKDENRERQAALISAAVNYVDTSDSRLKSVLGTLNRLSKHAEVVGDTNGMLKNVHLIMDESLKSVTEKNAEIKKELVSGPADESAIARMTRTEKLNELNEYITLTDDGAVDIANSIGGLTKHAVQIQAYKDTLRNESGSTKRLHLEGVSQMGEQLMSVISAISAAATSESRSMAANNFAKMAEQNQTIISQEVVRNATNIELEAEQIAKLVGELQDYGEVLNASSEIANQGYGRMRETVDAIRKVSGSVQGAIDGLLADRAEAGIANGGENEAPVQDQKASDPGFVNPFSRLETK